MLLPGIPIWASGSLLNRDILVVLLLLCGGHGDGHVDGISRLEYPKEGTRKSLIKEMIRTVERT